MYFKHTLSILQVTLVLHFITLLCCTLVLDDDIILDIILLFIILN